MTTQEILTDRDKEILCFALSNLLEGLGSTDKNEIDNLLERFKPKEPQPELYPRKCDACGDGMFEGFVIGGGEKYFCSEKCLHTEFTQEEYLKLYDGGEGSSYWTTWSIREIDEDEKPIYKHNPPTDENNKS